jgi:hypothetical protein
MKGKEIATIKVVNQLVNAAKPLAFARASESFE